MTLFGMGRARHWLPARNGTATNWVRTIQLLEQGKGERSQNRDELKIRPAVCSSRAGLYLCIAQIPDQNIRRVKSDSPFKPHIP